MNKLQKYHHSISELGNIQVRIIDEYQDDEGNVLDKKYSDPFTPSPMPTKDVESQVDGETVIIKVPLTQEEITEQELVVEDIGGFNMAGWDQKSKDIVSSITKPGTKIAFESGCQHSHGTGVEECVSHDRVIDEDGKIAVRRITRIFDEGKEVSKKYHRSWIMPIDDLSHTDVMSKAIAQKLHTVEVKQAYQNKMTEQAAKEL